MITKRLTGLVALVLALAGLVAAPAAQADPAPADGVHDMRGHFAMFTRGIEDPDMRPGTLDITTQLGSVLIGRANVTGRAVVVTGTVSDEGAVNLTGLDGLARLSIQAQIANPDPSEYVPCILEGGFRVTTLGRVQAQGDLVAVHQVPVTGAPSIGGGWEGVMIQDGGSDRQLLQASLAQTDTGALTGRMVVGVDNPDLRINLTLAGQAGLWDDPDIRPPYVLVGAGSGVLAIAIVDPGLIGDPNIRGTIRLLNADGTVQQATLQLHQAAR